MIFGKRVREWENRWKLWCINVNILTSVVIRGSLFLCSWENVFYSREILKWCWCVTSYDDMCLLFYTCIHLSCIRHRLNWILWWWITAICWRSVEFDRKMRVAHTTMPMSKNSKYSLIVIKTLAHRHKSIKSDLIDYDDEWVRLTIASICLPRKANGLHSCLTPPRSSNKSFIAFPQFISVSFYTKLINNMSIIIT